MQLINKNRLKKSAIVYVGVALSMFAGLSATAFASPVATATVNKGVNFRADQSTNAPIWGFVKAGTVLPIEAANNYWVLVDYNGKTGYVSRSYVTVHENAPAPAPAPQPAPAPAPAPAPQPAPAPAPAPQPAPNASFAGKIISTAESFQGKVKYVFGARDQQRLIFDCSSFTQYVFQLNGVHIPWGSRAQAQTGTYVPRDQLQPGDLVMFSVSTPGQINHVGIYMGNGQFINNLPHQGVVISNFNSSYWTSHYITGRRVK